MSTYITGVTDFIPQVETFSPDLNFYANVLQTKQGEYDANWQAMNKMYGQVYYADLTRSGNIEKRDQLVKQIDFNLRRVSQLDLSLEQNVNQATQIFRPFYEDKFLMKDMAWTKNYNRQIGQANMLQGSADATMREGFWETGMRALQYQRDEFGKLSDTESLGFDNPRYTRNVNVIEKAQKIAKESGLSIESVNFSPDGKWIVKTKNGEQLTEPLQKLFEASLGDDPAIQAKYQTQAYVNRKDYAYGNASMFGGNTELAEMKYLENSFNMLKEQNDQRYKQLADQSSAYDKIIADLESQIENGTAGPNTEKTLNAYKQSRDINSKILDRAEQENKNFSVYSSDGEFTNPYGDIRTLRSKVDAGMASLIMQKDLDEAATIFAFRDAKQDIEANPFAVKAEEHKYRMAEIDARGKWTMKAVAARIAGEHKNQLDAAAIESGAYIQDEHGNVVPNEAAVYTRVEDSDNTSVDETNLRRIEGQMTSRFTQNYATPHMQAIVASIEALRKSGKMTKQEAAEILSYANNKSKTKDFGTFNAKFQKYGSTWLEKSVGSKDMLQISQKFQNWVNTHPELAEYAGEELQAYRNSSSDFKDYTLFLSAHDSWQKDSAKKIVSFISAYNTDPMIKAGIKELYDENGNMRSYKDWAKRTGAEAITKATGSQMFAKTIFDAEESYNELVKIAYKAGSNAKTKLGVPPAIPTANIKNGTGLSSKGMTVSTVFSGAKGLPSYGHYMSMINDLDALDLNNTKDTRVTVGGISKSYGWDSVSKDDANINHLSPDVAKAVFARMKAEIDKPKGLIKRFDVKSAAFAAGSANKGAMVFSLPDEFIDSLTIQVDKEGNPKPSSTGLLTPGQARLMKSKGLNVITDSKNLNNNLYRSSFNSPLEGYLQYNSSVDFVDPFNPNQKVTISKDKTGSGSYASTVQYEVYDPVEGKNKIEKKHSPYFDMGQDFDYKNYINQITGAGGFFDQVSQYNNYQYQTARYGRQ